MEREKAPKGPAESHWTINQGYPTHPRKNATHLWISCLRIAGETPLSSSRLHTFEKSDKYRLQRNQCTKHFKRGGGEGRKKGKTRGRVGCDESKRPGSRRTPYSILKRQEIRMPIPFCNARLPRQTTILYMIPEPNDGMFSDGSRIGETFSNVNVLGTGPPVALEQSSFESRSVGVGRFLVVFTLLQRALSSRLLLTC